jgi:ubiquinone/menaquinone biosynthesis C-methylase UbiE
MKGGMHMEIEARARELERRANQKKESLHKELNQPLTFIQKAIVDAGFALYFDVFGKRPEIDQDAARLAGEKFGQFFPGTVEELLQELLKDPEGYSQKVEEYEKICPPVSVDFPTKPTPYMLITRDSSRQIQEVMTELALLSNFSSPHGKYYALDIGTGYGRLARTMEDTLRSLYNGRKGYKVFGMDILESNIEDAKKVNKETGSEIVFFVGDMNTVPFPSDTFNLVNTTDASYLNFRHRRPFYIAEITRVLSPDGGRGCITNPNEKTTLKEYLYLMMRSNYKTYMNPLNILRTTGLGQCSINIDDLVKARPDWEMTTTQDMANALGTALKTDIIDASNWPKQGGPAIYSGFTFAVTDKTKKALRKYIEFRDSQKEAENWINIEEEGSV